MMLELDDIQSGVLRPRPNPYAASYVLLRIADRTAGRALMGRLGAVLTPASESESRVPDTWVSMALTYRGLEVLGVPADTLASFAWEFRQGMRARASALGDTGESAPEHWESPLGTDAVHVVIVAVAPDQRRLDEQLARARAVYETLGGIDVVWQQDGRSLASGKELFGFKDGIGLPPIEGVAAAGGVEPPLKAGEFVLGYTDETGALPPMPQPEILGRNGTYVAFRKLHQRVAAFRRYLKENAKSPEDEELLAAKMMGRWRSGAPLALCPEHDVPAIGSDAGRNNDFGYGDDRVGYKTPPGCHIRRANPRDSAVAGIPRLHRMIRRGMLYGPELPEGVLDDDGIDRGLMFTFVGAHLGRQFEFVQSEWLNGGEFLSLGDRKDPIAGAADGSDSFSIPKRPIARCVRGLSRFVVTRGGEYGFMPGLRALRWLAELRS
jgi:Dyp-type peroxidase family